MNNKSNSVFSRLPGLVSIFMLLINLFCGSACSQDRRSLDFSKVHPGKVTSIDTGSIYLPINYSPSRTYSLVVLLHGLTKDDETFLESHPFRREAENRNYILYSPRSVRYFWLKESNTLDTYHIRLAINQITSIFPVDKKRILLFGWADGGEFAFTKLFQNERNWLGQKLFTAIVSGSAKSEYLQSADLPPRLSWSKRVPVFLFSGTLEGKNYDAEINALTQLGCTVTVWNHPGGFFLPDQALEMAFDWFDQL